MASETGVLSPSSTIPKVDSSFRKRSCSKTGSVPDAPQRSGLEAGPDSETGVEQSRAGSTGGKRGSGQSPRAEQASAAYICGAFPHGCDAGKGATDANRAAIHQGR